MGYLLIAFSLVSVAFVSASLYFNPTSEQQSEGHPTSIVIEDKVTDNVKIVDNSKIELNKENPSNNIEKYQRSPADKQQIKLNKVKIAQLKDKNAAQEKRIVEQRWLINHLQKQNSQLQDDNETTKQQLETKDAELVSLTKKHQTELAIANKPRKPNSDIELMKAQIDTQPDLITTKIKKKPKEQSEEVKEESRSPVKEPSNWDNFSGLTEFGYNFEKDNKTTRGLEGRLMLDYTKHEAYKINSDFEFEFEDEDDVETTNKSRWQLQSDYNLTPISTVFARADLNTSRYSSYNKEHIYSVGYGRILIDNKSHHLLAEAGPGYRSAEPNSGKNAVTVHEPIGRLRFQYSFIATKNLELKFDSVTEIGNENNIYTSILQAQNKIYRELYLVFEFEYKYTENVPVDTVNEEYTSGLKLLYAF